MSVAAAWWPLLPTPMATSSGCFRTDDYRSCTGGNDEPKEGHAEACQEHQRERQEVRGIHGGGTRRDERARQRAQGGREKGGRGERRAREDRRDAGRGSR